MCELFSDCSGYIASDPAALVYIMEAAGTVRPDGKHIQKRLCFAVLELKISCCLLPSALGPSSVINPSTGSAEALMQAHSNVRGVSGSKAAGKMQEGLMQPIVVVAAGLSFAAAALLMVQKAVRRRERMSGNQIVLATPTPGSSNTAAAAFNPTRPTAALELL
jgi:hypothetical protein